MRKKSDKNKNDKKKAGNSDIKEYGVVLKKDKKYRGRIYPQKGKVPEEEDESYKIV